MKERTQSILEASVREFIRTGHPITSELLYEEYDFGIKPAMIRWELCALTDEGYLFQTHPSGGRYPTNKAYRFYVDTIIQKDIQAKDPPWVREERMRDDFKGFVEDISGHLQMLSVGYDFEKGVMVGFGLRELLNRLETPTKEDILNVVKDFEEIESRLEKKKEWLAKKEMWPQVFIGESPVTKSEHLSVVVGKMEYGGNEVLILSIGPKRMDYENAVMLMKSLHHDTFEN